MLLKQEFVIFFTSLLLILSGCNTSSKTVKNEKQGNSKQSEVKIEIKKTEDKKNNESTVVNKSVKKPENEKVSKQKTQEDSTKNIISEKKVINKEYKAKETNSILETIEKLEECYETGNFEKWKSLLTPTFKEKCNDPEFLKQNGWNANDLKSFFYLLIQTREKNGIKSLPISRVEFVNPNKAYVYVIFNGKEFPKPQHTFIKIGNSWYKGLPDEGE